MPPASLMIVSGEMSGDAYGAQLATALQTLQGRPVSPRPVEIFGCGGDAMRKAGVETVVNARDISMVGITEVVRGLPRAYRALRLLVHEAGDRRPQLAVLIDSPSFNLRLAKRLKRLGIPVVYFVSPQIWAWKKWRIHEIKATVDKMLCIFDFEEEIYRKAGVPVEYVGHPLVDRVRPHLPRQEFFAQAGLEPDVTTVAFLPGSREIEISFNLPAMLEAAARLSLTRKIQFVIAAAPSARVSSIESILARFSAGRYSLRVLEHSTDDVLEHSDVAVVASGTATLEAALRERPMVVVYRVSAITGWLARRMIDVPFFSIVNLLAGKAVVPELVQHDFTAVKVASQVERLLDDAEARHEMIAQFRALRARLGPGGAVGRAAESVRNMLRGSPGAGQPRQG